MQAPRKFRLKHCLSILCILISTYTFSHDFFFAHAELEYNEMGDRLECTLTFTTHDLEKQWLSLGKSSLLFEKLLSDSSIAMEFSNFISHHFYVDLSDSQKTDFQIDGMESMTNGTTNLYMSLSLNGAIPQHIYFDLLMDFYPQQQNKLIFIYRESKSSYVFLPDTRKQALIISEP